MTKIISKPFFRAPDGTEVTLFELTNESGTKVEIIDWGATVVSMTVPDREGNFRPVMLTHPEPTDYIENIPAFGIVAGRYANRVANAEFELNGRKHQLAANKNGHCLHGGFRGFGRLPWRAQVVDGRLELTLESPDGDQGFPGNCKVKVVYSLSEHHELIIDYFAESDAATIVNLTNHAYFKLDDEPQVYNNEFFINAECYTPAKEQIPTGEIKPVKDTVFDLTSPVKIGGLFHTFGFDGFDHNFVLKPECATLQLPAAAAYSEKTGILLETFTTEPGMQFYTANALDQPHCSFCFEAQHFPDSPHHPNFPSTVLVPGELYRQTTIYRFSVR